MGRPKGSKNKTTLMKENGNINPVKKVIRKNTTEDAIKAVAKKKGRPILPKHVLRLTDYLYITCDAHCWKIVAVNDKVNPATGEKYPDKPMLYASTLQDMLKVATNFMIKVPSDYQEIISNIEKVYQLIDERVPARTRPKDLFEVYQRSVEELEDD